MISKILLVYDVFEFHWSIFTETGNLALSLKFLLVMIIETLRHIRSPKLLKLHYPKILARSAKMGLWTIQVAETWTNPKVYRDRVQLMDKSFALFSVVIKGH